MVKIELNERYQGRPSRAEMKRRWDLASKAMKEQDIDCLIMQANEGVLCQHLRWFAERRPTHYTIVMFDQDQNLSIISHGPKGMKVPTYSVEFANSICVPQMSNAWYGNNFISDQAIDIIKKNGYKKLGLLGLNLMSAAFYNNLTKSLPQNEVVDASEMIDQLVAVKSEEELGMLRDAVQLHDAVGNAIPALVYAGRLERELGADLAKLAIISGADEYLGNILIASQRIPAGRHPFHCQNKIIEVGDTLDILFEVPNKSGYYADFHHYWSVGDPLPEAVKAMELAQVAQEYMASICKPGAKASDIFNEMNEWKQSRGMGPETRMHGHGQGYGLVERPYFDSCDPMILKENMYLGLHPPVNVGEAKVNPSYNYIVTKDGAKRISTFTQKLVVI